MLKKRKKHKHNIKDTGKTNVFYLFFSRKIPIPYYILTVHSIYTALKYVIIFVVYVSLSLY